MKLLLFSFFLLFPGEETEILLGLTDLSGWCQDVLKEAPVAPTRKECSTWVGPCAPSTLFLHSYWPNISAISTLEAPQIDLVAQNKISRMQDLKIDLFLLKKPFEQDWLNDIYCGL